MKNDIALIDEKSIRNKIYIIRGKEVMIDSDLAEIYGYATRDFNKQVKNNMNKFDSDFMFQLTEEEFKNLMFKKSTSSWGGRRKLPYAFTEQGIYMLMTVLKGEKATIQSKALIRIFKKMKDYIIENNNNLVSYDDILKLSLQTNENTKDIKEIRKEMKIINDKFNSSNKLKEILILNGRRVESDNIYSEIYSMAKKCIYIIDDKEREEIKKELINILDSNSADILGFLDSIHIFNEGSIKNLKYNTIDEFELNLRKKIHNTLIKLSHYVNRKDLISEIVTGINDNINGIYSESKNKVVSIYLNSIYGIIESINNKVNIDRNYYSYYLEEMNKILNFNIDYNLSDEEIFGLLINTYRRLSKLEIELDSEININEYKVRVKNI